VVGLSAFSSGAAPIRPTNPIIRSESAAPVISEAFEKTSFLTFALSHAEVGRFFFAEREDVSSAGRQ